MFYFMLLSSRPPLRFKGNLLTKEVKMKNNLVTFNFNSNQVRTDSDNGQIWFCLRDLCNVLELPNITWVTKRLNQKGIRKTKLPTKGGLQEMIFVNEPNMYRTVTNSNKPQAVQFENWIYEEILPSIRKTGNYLVDKPVVVSEHTRSLPSGKKEIVLSTKAKEEIGGIFKRCVTSAICKSFDNLLASAEEVNTYKPISDNDLIRVLYNWYAGRHQDWLKTIQEQNKELDILRSKLATVKTTVENV